MSRKTIMNQKSWEIYQQFRIPELKKKDKSVEQIAKTLGVDHDLVREVLKRSKSEQIEKKISELIP